MKTQFVMFYLSYHTVLLRITELFCMCKTFFSLPFFTLLSRIWLILISTNVLFFIFVVNFSFVQAAVLRQAAKTLLVAGEESAEIAVSTVAGTGTVARIGAAANSQLVFSAFIKYQPGTQPPYLMSMVAG